MPTHVEPSRHVGPNVKRLIFAKMAKDAIPAGGGLAAGVAFLTAPAKIADGFRSASAWIFAALDLVKAAPDNPYGDDDEAIAAAILRDIDTKKGIPP